MSITVRYLHEYNKYKKQYGKYTLVLMQVGSFYEMYSTDTDGPNLKEIADLLNTVCTKKDKNGKEVSISNPYLVGFPMVATDKFVSLLIKNGYTLVMIDQTTQPPEPKREVTNIFSPSTYVGTTINAGNTYAACIYFEYEKQINNKTTNSQNLLCMGVSAIDITTGKVLIDETIPTIYDANLALDNVQRFISLTQPKEIFFVLNGIDGKYDINSLINVLQLDERIVKIKRYDDKYSKINYFISVFGSRIDWSIAIKNTKIHKDNIYNFSGIIFYQSCEDILIKNQKISNEFIEEFYTYFIYEDLFKYQQISEDTIIYMLSNQDNDYFSNEVWLLISLKQYLSKSFIKKYITFLKGIIIMNTNAYVPIKYLNNILKNIHKKKCYKFDNIIKNRIKPHIVKFWIKKYRKHKHLNIKKTLLKKNLPNEIINNVLRSYYL